MRPAPDANSIVERLGTSLRRASAELLHEGWQAGTYAEWRRFRHALGNPAFEQERSLRRIVSRAARSEFGRRHRFDRIDSFQAFRRHVPVADHEAFQPFIDRIRRGEQGILTGEPVERLVPTSGSTRATRLVPWTRSLRSEFSHAVAAWTHDLYRRHPACRGGAAYWSVSPAFNRLPIESAVPVGLEDDASYVGGLLAPLVRTVLAVPASVAAEPDHAAWRDRTLVSLLAAADLRLVSVWHPSFLALLLDGIVEHWDALLGALSAEHPRRARCLRDADPRELRAIWPSLSVVSAWADAHAARPAAELVRRLPKEVCFVPKGLLSTEAVASIPFEQSRPVAMRSHVLEWIPIGGSSSDAIGVEPLRVGERYEVVVTTGGGLYRCRTGDVVECDGQLGATPTLRFLGRADAVSDLRGEKLNDLHVAAAIGAALEAVGEASPGSRIRFAMLAPDDDPIAPRYDLLIEPHPSPSGDAAWLASVQDAIAARLDASLGENPHYALCRKLGQLAAPRVVAIREGAERRVLSERARRGQRLGDIKPTALAREPGWRSLLCEGEPPPRDRPTT